MDLDGLIELRVVLTRTKDTFDTWSAVNVAGKTAAELVEIDLGYKKAMMAYRKAYDEYQAALSECE